MCTHGVLTCPWIDEVMNQSILERILWTEYCSLHYSRHKKNQGWETQRNSPVFPEQVKHRQHKKRAPPNPRQPAVPQTTMRAELPPVGSRGGPQMCEILSECLTGSIASGPWENRKPLLSPGGSREWRSLPCDCKCERSQCVQKMATMTFPL